ncbi:MAG: hypothetical protein O7B79_10830 [SAR324 cluster bacterium]|nr:hypothetical protein [SAR324 cluster bacterium]
MGILRNLTGAAALMALLCCWGKPALAQSRAPDPGEGQLRLIDAYYREGEAFRAESEVLRFLHEYPAHPRRAEAELLRAKLFYRDGRYGDSTLMLISQLDRFPHGPAAFPAARLLTFSLLREGRLDEAERYLPYLRGRGEGLRGRGGPRPSLDALRKPLSGAPDPDSAVALSTWLPGAGFFALGEPGKAFAGMGLNLFLIAASYLAFEEDLPVVGLAFLIAEIAVYRGGREAVREEAEAQIARFKESRREGWIGEWGEGKLLKVGIRVKFSGE